MDDPDGVPGGLAPIQPADKSYFQQVFANLAQPLSDYSFANTYVWGSSLKLYWARIDRHLCVFANGTGDLTMLMPPLPQAGATEVQLRDCVQRCFQVMDEYNERVGAGLERSRIEYVSDEMLERLHAVRGLSLSATPMGGDYVYDMARMIDLGGGALKSKRHARSKFMRDFPDHRTEAYDDRHHEACLELLHNWARHGDATHDGEVSDAHVGTDILRHRDTLAVELALGHWRELGLRGMTLWVGERLAGFTFGESLSACQASILIEKTHPEFHGAAQFIFSEFCRRYWSDHSECNAGDDWGIPSLRFTKSSYRPMRLLNKSMLTRQASVVVGGFEGLPVPASNTVASISLPPPAPAPRVEPAPLPAVNFRRAVAQDVAALVELEAACFTSAQETFNRRQIRYLVSDRRAAVTVAEMAGRVVGWAVGLVRQHRRGRSGRLYALAVHPQAQGRQLGRQLAQQTLDRLAQLGISRVFLEVRVDNQPAINLYRRMGFAAGRFLPNYYGAGRHGQSMKLVQAIGADQPTLWQELPEKAAAR